MYLYSKNYIERDTQKTRKCSWNDSMRAEGKKVEKVWTIQRVGLKMQRDEKAL